MSDKKFKTYKDKGLIIPPMTDYAYQIELTWDLDCGDQSIDQNWINQVVLWKVNRYVKIGEKTLNMLQAVKADANNPQAQPNAEVIEALLKIKGVQIAMASTILRFCNPKVYQIIDQRVFRFIYGADQSILNVLQDTNGDKRVIDVENATKQYLNYLLKLHEICPSLGIKFEDSDRLLYLADKKLNQKDYPLKASGRRPE